jgi:hypothetical protein
MCCAVSCGIDSAYDADAGCGESASSTPSEKRHSSWKAAAPRFCVDSRISTLERETICLGSGTMGPSAATRCGLGGTCLESAREWVGLSQWILAVICGFTQTDWWTGVRMPEKSDDRNLEIGPWFSA